MYSVDHRVVSKLSGSAHLRKYLPSLMVKARELKYNPLKFLALFSIKYGDTDDADGLSWLNDMMEIK